MIKLADIDDLNVFINHSVNDKNVFRLNFVNDFANDFVNKPLGDEIVKMSSILNLNTNKYKNRSLETVFVNDIDIFVNDIDDINDVTHFDINDKNVFVNHFVNNFVKGERFIRGE